MRKLRGKTKFILQVVLGFLFSALVYTKALFGNDIIDEIAAKNLALFLVLFTGVVFASLLANYGFDRVKEQILIDLGKIWHLLSILNYQIMLFSLIYFFMDTIFDNAYIKVPFHADNYNIILNLSILSVFTIIYRLRNKKCTIKQLAKTAMISGIIILQLNYIEILFFSLYFIFLLCIKRGRRLMNLKEI